MIIQKILLMFLFPLTFFLGRFVLRQRLEEVEEVLSVSCFLNRVLVLIMFFLVSNSLWGFFMACILCAILTIYLVLYKNTIIEHILVFLMVIFGIFYFIETIIFLGLIIFLLKGFIFYKKSSSRT